jgi:hypothetical protein
VGEIQFAEPVAPVEGDEERTVAERDVARHGA